MKAALQTEDDIRLVQLPHPGGEHRMPESGRRPWKRGDEAHRRTFLQSPGTYRLTVDGKDQVGEVAFWGEWEGGVELVTELKPVEHGPRWLCRPDPLAPPPPVGADGAPPQNTDPFVWGDAIRYTFCRQGRNAKLRRLGRGSVILFGSGLAEGFVLDTVLVVRGWVDHRSPADLSGDLDEEFRRATIEPMYGWGSGEQTYRLYVGASPEDSVDGMFSFVPCRPAAGAASGFRRPVTSLNGLVNPHARMQARVSNSYDRNIAELWRSAADEVGSNGLALATHLLLRSAPA